MSASEADHIEEHEDRANRDGSVCNVERPEVRRSPVDVHEIHDVSKERPIDQVTKRLRPG